MLTASIYSQGIGKVLIYITIFKEKAVSEAVSKIKSCEQVPLTAQAVIKSLERAGGTLLALRVGGYHPGLAQRHWEVLPERFPGYVPDLPPMRLPAPTPAQVVEMDEVLNWVLLIPESEMMLRRVVNARCMRHPLTDAYLFSWRKIALAIGTDYKLIQRRHEKGIKIILGGLLKCLTTGYENGSGAEMRQ